MARRIVRDKRKGSMTNIKATKSHRISSPCRSNNSSITSYFSYSPTKATTPHARRSLNSRNEEDTIVIDSDILDGSVKPLKNVSNQSRVLKKSKMKMRRSAPSRIKQYFSPNDASTTSKRMEVIEIDIEPEPSIKSCKIYAESSRIESSLPPHLNPCDVIVIDSDCENHDVKSKSNRLRPDPVVSQSITFLDKKDCGLKRFNIGKQSVKRNRVSLAVNAQTVDYSTKQTKLLPTKRTSLTNKGCDKQKHEGDMLSESMQTDVTPKTVVKKENISCANKKSFRIQSNAHGSRPSSSSNVHVKNISTSKLSCNSALLDSNTPNRYGLVRFNYEEENQVVISSTPISSQVIEIYRFSMLGRNATASSNLSKSKKVRTHKIKIDLGIDRSADGVSRKHVEIMEVLPSCEGLTIRINETLNPIRLIRPDEAKNKQTFQKNKSNDITFKPLTEDCEEREDICEQEDDQSSETIITKELLHAGEKSHVRCGDLIVFDAYESNPIYVFKLVSISFSNGGNNLVKAERKLSSIASQNCLSRKSDGLVTIVRPHQYLSDFPSKVDTSATENTIHKNKHCDLVIHSSQKPILLKMSPKQKHNEVPTQTSQTAKITNCIVDKNLLSNESSTGSHENDVRHKQTSPKIPIHASSPVKEALSSQDPTNIAKNYDKNYPHCHIIKADRKEIHISCGESTDYSILPVPSSDSSIDSKSEPNVVNDVRLKPQTKHHSSQPSNEKNQTQENKITINVKKEEMILNTRKKNKIFKAAKVEIGDRFRVLFNVPDMFGVERENWFFGTVMKLNRKKDCDSFILNIKFDDGILVNNINWPDPEVEKLCQISSDGIVKTEDSGEVAFSYPMSSSGDFVRLGDAVEVMYQGGHCGKKFFLGRVAAIQPGSKIDIVYNDKSFECSVPIQSDFIRLLSNGFPRVDWLIGLGFPHKDEKNTTVKLRIIKKAIVEEKRRKHMLELFFDDGTSEKRNYTEVMEILFSCLKKKCPQNKIREWPTLKRTRNQRKKPSLISSCKTDKSSENKKCFSEAPTKSINCLTDESSNCALQIDTQILAKELHTSLGNSLWRALNSAEPQNGANILVKMASIYDHSPNRNFKLNLLDMLKYGPKSEGIALSDPNKTELAFIYSKLIARKFPARKFKNGAGMGLSWIDFQDCFNNPVKSALLKGTRRTANSLQCAACVVEYIYMLLDNDMLESRGLSKDSQRKLLSFRPANALYICGMRDALKDTIRATMKFWFCNYKYIHTSNSCFDDKDCAMSALRCTSAFGKLCCTVALLYCSDENKKLDSNECAEIFREVVLSEFENEKDPAVKIAKDDIKISFVMSLDHDAAKLLQIAVGKILGLSSVMKITGIIR
mmetsp:Transcript_55642/g.67095  ORF Transcript_55642/g.67095 Transcript_55642/m.67095 type:complete len:1352 (-) Transcript_55642:72-4127(-)